MNGIRPNGSGPVVLACRDLRKRFGEKHRRRAVDDHPQRAFRAVLAQEHDGLTEIGIAQAGGGDQEHALVEWKLWHHTVIILSAKEGDQGTQPS